MNVIVKKPTDEEILKMKKHPIWECEPSTFDWYYDSQETCLILEGEVIVEFDDGSVGFGEGDYVVFPKGLSCVWKVSKTVRKHYLFS